MKCSDIPTQPILAMLNRLDGKWANWYFGDDRDVSKVMPDGVPDKLRLAKMKQLMAKGLVDGCDCGCRGDFVITPKGRDRLDVVGGGSVHIQDDAQ